MNMIVLIVILLVGGMLAWQFEKLNPNLPRTYGLEIHLNY